MNHPLYFDYAATTPLDPLVIERMVSCLKEQFGNPASRSHAYGWAAEALVEEARQQVANLIHADPRELVWTSGATESNNLALKGAAYFYQRKGKHIITSKIEHKSVLDTCRQLEREGYTITYLAPEKTGIVSLKSVQEAVREDTILISMMHANNEIGVLQEIEAIGDYARKKGILFHVDAAQTAGKLPLDMEGVHQCIDLLSLSGHKMYGPKGIGVLYVRRKPRVRLTPQMHGGGHERGFRSGTLATHQIVGMGEACRIAKTVLLDEAKRVASLRARLWEGLKDMEEIYLNGSPEKRLPGILNVSINYVEGESLIMGLKDLALSSGSACTSASLEPSYVLRALGRNDELAHSSLRFSIGRFTKAEEIDFAIVAVKKIVKRLRDMSPLWEMFQQGIDLETIEWAAH